MFSKCRESQTELVPSAAEAMADLLYEIGKDLSQKGNLEVAVRWLERAHDVIGQHDIGNLSPDAGELRLSIIQGLG